MAFERPICLLVDPKEIGHAPCMHRHGSQARFCNRLSKRCNPSIQTSSHTLHPEILQNTFLSFDENLFRTSLLWCAYYQVRIILISSWFCPQLDLQSWTVLQCMPVHFLTSRFLSELLFSPFLIAIPTSFAKQSIRSLKSLILSEEDVPQVGSLASPMP